MRLISWVRKAIFAAAATAAIASVPATAHAADRPVKIGLVDYAVDARMFENLANVTVKSITFQSTGYTAPRFQSRKHQRGHGDVMTDALLSAFRQLKPETPVEIYVATPFLADNDGRVILDPEQLAFSYDWFAFQGVKIVAQTFVSADNDGLRSASARAASLGLIILASAGNGPSENAVPPYPASYDSTIGISTTALESSLSRETERNRYVGYSVPAIALSSIRLRNDPELASLRGSSHATASAAGILGALSTRCHIGTTADARAVLDAVAVPVDATPNGRAYGRGVLVPELISQRIGSAAERAPLRGVLCGQLTV